MPTLSDLLAQKLASAGITVVFGLPGGENVDILDSLRRHGIEFVLVRNESSAIFMADVHARLTRGIGAALTTLGPGASNSYAGIAHAWLDRAPVLLLTAQTDPKIIGAHTHQVLELGSVFRPVTKFTAQLMPDSANETIDYAIALLKSGRPGPVHLSIPASLASHHVEMLQPPSSAARTPPQAAVETIELARNILKASHHPVILVGLGLEPMQPYSQLRALAELLGAPVIDTPKSKGALSADHPLFVGTLGLTSNDPAYEILDASDCILAIGFDVVELVKPWNQPQALIWISNWDNQDPHIDSACELVGSIGDTLDGLLNATHNVDESWGARGLPAWREVYLPRSKMDPAPNRMLPSDALDSIREHTPPETVVTTDVGSHKIFTCLHWKALRPNRFFVSNGLSVMGFGLTSAIAAARVTREPTMCITGDAGLAMMMGELALMIELDLPVIVVVMNDSALDLIRYAQKRKNLQVFGTEFANPDYEKIASAFGLSFARIQNKSECDVAVQAAVASGKPTLLEVMVDPAGYR
jgi:acetolactate synthase-1/2/3 large subunit